MGSAPSEKNHWMNVEINANFPPQDYIENAKSSVYAEGQHHYNIFFLECGTSPQPDHSDQTHSTT